jgi:hypothetical protein
MTQPIWRSVLGCGLLATAAACTSTEPLVVASNCPPGEACVKSQALRLDAVDILLVVDNSGSLSYQAAALKEQLPRMLTAITHGGEGETSFPAIQSVHVALTTTDLGIGTERQPFCESANVQDAVFVKPGEVGVTCDASYPGYLNFEGGPAALATAESVACVPLVFSDEHSYGCGVEQPLEAALKSLWPADDSSVTFTSTSGHGASENAGFLRPSSLLVVVVVTDEDDCSAEDLSLFEAGPDTFEKLGAINLRCFNHASNLFPVERYVQSFKQLRPDNDNVVFAVIAGVPPELVSDSYRAGFDLSTRAGVSAYYDAVLDHEQMQEVPQDADEPQGFLRPSCVVPSDVDMDGDLDDDPATPPRRLVEAARGFGEHSVLGSICADDFGETTGQIIRMIGDKLLSQP